MSAAKAKGTRWESELVAAFHRAGFPHVERRALNGAADRGDLTGVPGVVVEAKDQMRHSFAEWLDEAEQEAANDGDAIGVVWAHRRGKARGEDGYVVMTGRTFLELLIEAGYR